MTWTHPCHMLWNLAGTPAPTAAPRSSGRCAHCSEVGPLSARLGPNFTDYRRLIHIDGSALCVPCSWTTGGKPPHGLRMWSIVARVDQPAPPGPMPAHVSGRYLHLTNRRDMRWVAETLANPPDGPWLVAVAETGQKHTAPFAAVNRGQGKWTVQLDGCDVTSTPAGWRTVLAHVVALRAAGFRAEHIESGQPPVIALTRAALPIWQANTPYLAPHVATPLLHLANMMITKETLGEYLSAN